jgi:hypothetical protein
MTRPTNRVSGQTFARHDFECVAGPVGCAGGLEWGHREASGQGGRGSKAAPLTSADGVAQCSTHNAAAEAEEQRRALENGWKIKRFRGDPPIPADQIPYFVVRETAWYVPGIGKEKTQVDAMTALDLLHAAGSLDGAIEDVTAHSREVRRIRALGYHVTFQSAEPVVVGAVISRFEFLVTDHYDNDLLVAVLRCTREGEYLGGGWVQTLTGTRAVTHLVDVLALLEGRKSVA